MAKREDGPALRGVADVPAQFLKLAQDDASRDSLFVGELALAQGREDVSERGFERHKYLPSPIHRGVL